MAVAQDFIHVGTLREVVKFEKNQPTDTASGGAIDGYIEFLTARAKVRQMGSGNRVLEAHQMLMNNQFQIITRFQAALYNELNGTATPLRIVYNNEFYTIQNWNVYNERFRYIIFNVSVQHP